jgi:hypothetical protein
MKRVVRGWAISNFLYAQSLALTLLFSIPSISNADDVTHTFSYQGRLFNATGVAPLTDIVDLKFEILNPNATCVLYEQSVLAIDLSLTKGVFAARIGADVGDLAVRSGADPNLSMRSVFANAGVAIRADDTATTNTCPGGYTPASGDHRILRVTVHNVTLATTATLTPNQVIQSVPMATVAETLQGITPAGLIQVSATVTQGNLTTLTDGSDAGALHHHDARYVQLGSVTAQNLGTGGVYTGGAIGIGTNAPNTAIEIDQNNPAIRLSATAAGGGVSEIQFYSGATERARIQSDEAVGNLKFYTNGTLGLTIDQNQNALFAGNLTTAGFVSMGRYTDATEATLITGYLAGCGVACQGTVWDNTDKGTLRYWNGIAAEAVASYSGARTAGGIMYGTATGLAVTGAGVAGQILQSNGAGAPTWVPLDDTAKLPLAGGAMSGAIDMNGQLINDVGAPLAAGDATNKGYVDGVVSGAASAYVLRDGSQALTANWNVGGFSLTNIGQLELAAQKTFLLGTFDNAQEAALVASPLGAGDAGKTWYNSQTDEIKFWDGAVTKVLGLAGAGLQSINGDTTTAQVFTIGSTGNSPNIVDNGTGTHTIHIPLANAAATVTAGLISNADYVTFTGKVDRAGDTMTGDLNMSGTKRVVNMADPAVAQDAATKNYADTKLVSKNLVTPTIAEDLMSVRWNNTAGNWEYYTPQFGTVTSVSASDPLASSGGATPTISLNLGNGLNLDGANDLQAKAGTAIIVNAGGINVDVGVGNNQVVQLDGTAKLPAVDGSQLINLNATALTSGTVADARLSANVALKDAANSFTNANDITVATATKTALVLKSSDDNLTAPIFRATSSVGATTAAIPADGVALAATDLTTKGYVDGTIATNNGSYVAKAGDTMGGILNMNSHKITNVTDPTNPQDAATMKYVGDTITASEADYVLRDGTQALTGNWNVGGFNVSNVGNLGLAAQKTMLLGTFDNAQEATLIGTPLVAGDAGKAWYNSQTNEVKYWDGGAVKILGVAGAGLQSIDGDITNAQVLAAGSSGKAPNWTITVAGTHQINIPLAGAGAGVTAGLISNADYVTFNAKLAAVSNAALLANTKVWIGDGTGKAQEQSISGDATIDNVGALTLKSVGTAGTYTKVTTDAQGRVTSATTLAAADIPALDWAKITTGTPTTLGGYGITDGVLNAGGTPSVLSDTFANIPAFGTAGRLFVATDTKKIYRDTGAAWEEISVDTASGAEANTASNQGAGGVGAYHSKVGVDLQFKNINASATNLVTVTDDGPNKEIDLGLNIANLEAALTLGNIAGTLPVSKGGTGSSTALSNNRVMVSSSGNIVEGAAITANRAVASDANGIPVATAVTDTELGYVSGVTSAIQTQIDSKVAKVGDTMTGALNVNVPTTTANGIVLKSTDDNLTKNAFEVRSSTNVLKASIPADGAPLVGTDLTTKTYVDGEITTAAGNYVLRSGTQALTGNWDVGGFNITNVGNLGLAAQKTVLLGTFDNAQEATLIATPLVAGDAGKTWYNSQTDEIKFWDGGAVKVLGVAGAGLQSIDGDTTNAQVLAAGSAGNAPNWTIPVAGTHQINIPLANAGAGVTAGLISNADHVAFTAKLSAVSNAALLANTKVWIGDGTGKAQEQSISGDATIDNVGALTLKNTGTAGTYPKVTTDAQGRVTAGAALAAADIPALDWAKITTGTPTTLGGYGITDGVLNAGGTPSMLSDTFANIPAFGTAGRLFVATDTKKIYRDTGAAWEEISVDTASGAEANTASNQGAGGVGAFHSKVGVDLQFKNLNASATNLVTVTDDGPNKEIDLGLNIANLEAALTLGNIAGTLPVSKGGTGSTTALSNNRVMVSSGGNIVEGAAITANRAVASDANGIPIATAVTDTELGYVSGVTSAIQTQIDGRVAKAGDTMTGALNVNVPTTTANGIVLKSTDDNLTKNAFEVRSSTNVLKASIPADGAPLVGTDLTTKTYVDGEITTAAGNYVLRSGTQALTGNWDVGGFNITNIGNLGLAAQKTVMLGIFDNAQEATLVGTPLVAGDEGKTWYNSQTNEIKFWDGTAVKILGVAGAGLQSIDGDTTNAQVLAAGSAGNAPNWTIPVAGTHQINIPLANSGAGVTAGLISNADHVAFTAKLSAVSNAALLANTKVWIGDGTGKAQEQSISGDATIDNVGALTLKNTGTAGTYPKVTTDAQGRVTAGAALAAADIPALDWAKITTGTPTTLGGYGITDGVLNAGGTPSLLSDTFANIPAFGTAGRLFVATDTKKIYRDTGAAWEEISVDTASGAEANTASNQGAGGVGAYHSKVGVDLQFKNINASATSLVTVTDDAANKEIDLGLNIANLEAALTLGNIAGTLPVSKGGTGSTTALSNNRVMVSSGGNIVEGAAITANRALASDANGIPVASAVSDTELGYVDGVTSAIQTQIDGKVAKAGDTMGGALNMGGFDLTNIGKLEMAAQKTFLLGSYDNGK